MGEASTAKAPARKRRRRSPSRGEEFLRRVHDQFELSPSEAEIAREAAAVLDLIDELTDPRELRLQRDLLRRLLSSLALNAGESESEVSRKARRAARARWSRIVPGPWPEEVSDGGSA